MRGIALRRGSGEEDESVFVSMTDMTISFLIILMILLAFFASRFSNEDMVPRSELEEMQQGLEAELSATRKDLANARSDLSQVGPELTSSKSSLRDARSTIDALNVTIRQLQTELAALRLRFQQLRQGRHVTQSAFDEELERLEAELSATRKDLANARSDLSQVGAELTSSKSSLRDARSTIDALNVTIRQLQTELAALRPLRRPDPLEEYLVQVARSRQIALRYLRDAIRQEFPALQVVISSEADALRFQGEGLFESNARTLSVDKRQIVERISELLDEILPCYSLGARSDHSVECNPGFAVIEAVQIEGHTDNSGTVNYNIGLSSARAVSTYLAMSEHVSGLLDHTNLDGEPVLSVAGYGEARPVVTNNTQEGRSTNRRIDLRFIMYSPNRSEEIERIRRKLADGAITELRP